MALKIFFIVIFALMAIIITVSLIRLHTLEGNLARAMRVLAFSGILPVVTNIVAFATTDFKISEIFFSLFFMSIDELLVHLLLFIRLYSDQKDSYLRHRVVMAILIVVDNISILLNIFFHHAFEVEQVYFKGATYYVATKIYTPYYVHLIICYLMCMISFLILIRKTISSPSIYKIKYYMILLPLIIVVIVDGMAIFLNLPVNYSIIAYGIMIIIFEYLTFHYAPQALINNTVLLAVENMNAGIICFDYMGKYAFSNKALWNIFGLEESKEVAEKAFAERTAIFGLDEKEHYKWDERLAVGAKIVFLSVDYSKVYDARNQYVGTYIHMVDNSEQIRHNEELLQQVRDENEAKTNFVSRISHEIRTPLNSVYGMNEMILQETDNPKIIEYANDIKVSTDMVINIINDVLDYSRVSAGKMELICENYNLGNMLTHLRNMMQVPAKKKGIDLVIDVSPSIPAMINGDSNRIEQILVNLISNAIKYTTAGSVRLTIAGRQTGDNIRLHFAVKDTGIGIKKEDIPRLFVAYDRIEEVKHHSIQGTGLGINITVQLLKLMNSELMIDSEYGEGSTFSFEIDQKVVPDISLKVVDILGSSADNKKTEKKEQANYKGKRVLVVDDTALNRKVIREMLKATKAEFFEAVGGEECLDFVMKQKFDLILLDHMMPDINGIDVFNRMKETENPNKQTPIIMLTANVMDDAEKLYMDMGFDGFLAKPVKPDVLYSLVDTFLG